MTLTIPFIIPALISFFMEVFVSKTHFKSTLKLVGYLFFGLFIFDTLEVYNLMNIDSTYASIWITLIFSSFAIVNLSIDSEKVILKNKFYVSSQLILLIYLGHKIFASYEYFRLIELTGYFLYFAIGIANLNAIANGKKKLFGETLRHGFFLMMESSYFISFSALNFSNDLLLLLGSFISLNWYIIVNTNFSRRIDKKA